MNEVSKYQQFQIDIVEGIAKTLKNSQCELTPYGKKCAVNCIAGIISFLKQNGKSLKDDIDLDLLKLSVQNIALTELNYASLPPEIYFDLRGKNLTVKPQGAGNEKLVRTYGVGVKELSSPWLVREGDEFTLPSYDGDKINPPKWVQKSLNGKVVAVVYRVLKTNGETEWLISGREEVCTNLIAQIRQNSLYAFQKKDVDGKPIYNKFTHRPLVDEEKRDAFYESLEGRTLDDLLADKSLRDYINPTYTSGGSREAMIVRKMKNNALKNYPREYNNALQKDAVQNMFEENDESILEKPIQEVDITPIEEDAPLDFDITDDGEIKENKKVEQQVKQQVQENDEVKESKNSKESKESIELDAFKIDEDLGF